MNIPSHTGDDYTRKTAAAEPSAADEERQEREEKRERREFKIGQFYTYTLRDAWCREGIAEVTTRGVLDTYWGSNGSESSPLNDAEKASSVLLFDSADYDELDRYCSSSKHRWGQYHPDDRKKTTEQHGCYTRWFVSKGALPDLGTRIANARVRLAEAEQDLRSAQWTVEARTRELAELTANDPERSAL